MTHLTLTIANYLQNPISELLNLFGNFAESYKRYRNIRSTEKELGALSDWELRDIGISRGDIYALARGDKSLIKSGETNSNLKGWV